MLNFIILETHKKHYCSDIGRISITNFINLSRLKTLSESHNKMQKNKYLRTAIWTTSPIKEQSQILSFIK
jgi:hypothetical protein